MVKIIALTLVILSYASCSKVTSSSSIEDEIVFDSTNTYDLGTLIAESLTSVASTLHAPKTNAYDPSIEAPNASVCIPTLSADSDTSDLDGDEVPNQVTYQFDCESTDPEGTAETTLEDKDDQSTLAGFLYTVENMNFTQSETTYTLKNVLTESLDATPLTSGYEVILSYKLHQTTDYTSDSITDLNMLLRFAFDFEFQPDTASLPFQGGSWTFTDSMVIGYGTKMAEYDVTLTGFHMTSTDCATNGIDSGLLEMTDKDDNTLKINFNSDCSYKIYLNNQQVTQ